VQQRQQAARTQGFIVGVRSQYHEPHGSQFLLA
jgi:hypothetical protein